jgi:hypothetical protein
METRVVREPASSAGKLQPLFGHTLPIAALKKPEIDCWRSLLPDDPLLGSAFLSPGFSLPIARAGVDVRVCVLRRGREKQTPPVGFRRSGA